MWVWFAVAVGVALRLTAYAADRSITLDESLVSLNILRRDSFGLLRKLDWNSGAPLAFLETEKAVTSVLGGSEHVLRLVPFLASVAALVLVALVARRVLPRAGVVTAVVVIAVLPPVVDYGAVVKQYSTDIAVVLALLLVGIWSLDVPLTRVKAGVLAVACSVAPLFSHPGVFVALSCTLTLGVAHVLHPEERPARRVAVVLASSAVVTGLAAVLYLLTLRGIAHGLAGDSVTSFDDVRSLVGEIRIVMGVNPSDEQPWATLDGIAGAVLALVYVAGIVAIARRRWEHAMLLVLPLVFAGASVAASAYPHEVRTLLFVAPLLVLPLAGGASWLISRGGPTRVLGFLTICLVLILPMKRTIDGVMDSRRSDDRIAAALTYLARHQRPGDAVYLWQTTQYPFAFAFECSCFDLEPRPPDSLWPVRSVPGTHFQWASAIASRDPHFVIGAYEEPRDVSFETELERLRGRRRVWVLLSALESEKRVQLLQKLDSMGRRLQAFDPTDDYEGVDAYLYDLRAATD